MWILPLMTLLLAEPSLRAESEPIGHVLYLEDRDDHPLVSRSLVSWSASSGERRVLLENILWSFDAYDAQRLDYASKHALIAINAKVSKRRKHPNVSLGLHLVDWGTGKRLRVHEGGSIQDMTFDAEGSRLLYWSRTRVWLYDVEEDDSRLLLDALGDHEWWVQDAMFGTSEDVVVLTTKARRNAPKAGLYILSEDAPPKHLDVPVPDRLLGPVRDSVWLISEDPSATTYDPHVLSLFDAVDQTRQVLVRDLDYRQSFALSSDLESLIYVRSDLSTLAHLDRRTGRTRILHREGLEPSLSPDDAWVVCRDRKSVLRIVRLDDLHTIDIGRGSRPLWIPSLN